MALFKRKHSAQQSLAEIRLSPRPTSHNHYTQDDHFFTDETITGHAIFKLSPGVQFSHSKITLKGTVKTSTEDTPTGAFAKSWRTERFPFLGVVYDGKVQAGSKGDDGVIRIPFRFNLSECEKLSAFSCDLPPSLDSHQEGQKASDCQYEVTYSISATAYSAKATLASASQKVFILPIGNDSFSEGEHLSDVPGEFFWATQSNSSSPRHTKLPRLNAMGPTRSPSPSGNRIELAGQEPEPILLSTESGVSRGSADVPFIVKVSHPSEVEESYPSECHVKARLVTKTHMTPDGIKQIGSNIDIVKTGGKHVTKTQIGNEQDFVIPINDWERCIGCTTDPFSVARFALRLNVDDGSSPLPTFFTPLLSRRYALDLTITFPESSNNNYKLSLPVEMVHGGSENLNFDDQKRSDAKSSAVEARL